MMDVSFDSAPRERIIAASKERKKASSAGCIQFGGGSAGGNGYKSART